MKRSLHSCLGLWRRMIEVREKKFGAYYDHWLFGMPKLPFYNPRKRWLVVIVRETKTNRKGKP